MVFACINRLLAVVSFVYKVLEVIAEENVVIRLELMGVGVR